MYFLDNSLFYNIYIIFSILLYKIIYIKNIYITFTIRNIKLLYIFIQLIFKTISVSICLYNNNNNLISNIFKHMFKLYLILNHL